MKYDEKTLWHTLSINEIFTTLKTDPEQGLSHEEAAHRLKSFGYNELAEVPPPTFWEMLWEQFNNFVIWMLIAAAIISAFLGDYLEAAAIAAIVILNAVLGVIQERNAQNSLASLKKLAAPEATVLRSGSRITIPAREVVPGDIVFLEAGNYIPADVRLIETMNLRVEEAALTGESVPVQKDACSSIDANANIGDRKNMGFMGTIVSYGRGNGVVVSTGMQTQIGYIAELLQAVEEEETPLQRRLNQLGKTLGIASMIICGIVFIVGMIQGNDPLNMFIVAVSLAVAAVPEGLPAVVTISLALGMRQMIKRHALIRRLSSVETLGSATVICSDKTGTFTQNQMTVTHIWIDGSTYTVSGSGYHPEGKFHLNGEEINILAHPALRETLWISALNNDSVLEESFKDNGLTKTYRMVGDPTEGSLLVAATKAGMHHKDLKIAYPRVAEIPFDSNRKRMVTVHTQAQVPDQLAKLVCREFSDCHIITVKGAADLVLNLCSSTLTSQGDILPLTEEKRREILLANDQMSKQALRILAIAYKQFDSDVLPENTDVWEKDLIFCGLMGMIDPPRPEIPPAIITAKRAGLRTIMITGDYPNTASAIASEVGLMHDESSVLTGTHLDNLSDEELQEKVKNVQVFARVSPEHKVRIVEALKKNGEIVAMTGDGVNDAPSIKLADIGVAMGITGTDVAKDAADMVLTDDNYASIVAAIEEGRVIYSNIRKFVYYLLSCNLAEIAIIFLSTLFFRSSALTAIQLLWLNLVTDGAPALALGTEKAEPGIMEQPPRSPDEPIINRFMQFGIIVQTIAITAVTMIAYMMGIKTHPTMPAYAETMAFTTLSLSELARAYTARSERVPLLKIGIFTNRFMNLAFISSALLVFIVIYTPFLQNVFNTTTLEWQHWEMIIPLLLIPSLAAEAVKVLLMIKSKRQTLP